VAVERSVLVPLPAVQWGGLQTFAVNLSAGLKRAGWRWTVVVPSGAAEVQRRLRQSGVEVVSAPLLRFRRSPWLTLRTVMGLAGNVRLLANLPEAGHATVIQAVGAHHFHGPLLARKLQKPLVWQVHSSILPPNLRRLVSPIISARANAIMTNGRAVAKAFWRKESLGPNHFVFYAPVDTDKYAPSQETRATARRALNCDHETVMIGTVGNYVWQKNHGFLVEAAGQLSPLYPKVRFLIIGAVHEEYRKRYEETVKRPAAILNQQFPEYIRFLDPGNQVAHWLQALDIFALTSHAEGVPIALFEAMCATKPVVSANVGSISEIIAERQTGFLYEPGDLSTFAARLGTLLESRLSRESMGQAGRRRVLDHFSIQSIVQAHVSAYETAIATYAARR